MRQIETKGVQNYLSLIIKIANVVIESLFIQIFERTKFFTKIKKEI